MKVTGSATTARPYHSMAPGAPPVTEFVSTIRQANQFVVNVPEEADMLEVELVLKLPGRELSLWNGCLTYHQLDHAIAINPHAALITAW